MAQNKKSVVIYTDWGNTFDELTNEEAGKLAKFMFDYVRDRNPVTEDRLIKIAFEPMKQQLKRDLKSWEAKSNEKSESGKLGNLKKWHPDLYMQVIAKEIALENAVIIAKDRKVSLSDNSIAKIAVNVIDTVTVNVNESEESDFSHPAEKIEMPVNPLKNSNLFRKPIVPTIDEVKEVFTCRGGTVEMADKFFQKHNSVDWYLNNSPIMNFLNLVPGYISSWQKNNGPPVVKVDTSITARAVKLMQEQHKNKINAKHEG
jgi:hypothetical protein